MRLDVNEAIANETQASLAFPKIVGCYSLDGERSYLPDLSRLKYLANPGENVRFDLNRGFRQFTKKPPDCAREEKIKHLLEFIARNIHKLRQPDSEKPLRYDFVCFRGLLTKIMVTPFLQEDWTICATRLRGTVYMCAFDEEEERYSPNKDKFIYWGYKFENYMFASAPKAEPDAAAPANANEEFCVMFSSRVNDTLVLYGAEVDGVDSETAVDPKNEVLRGVKLVEVKTNRFISSQKDERTFLLKTLKWFCQSYLVGIDDIFVGFRDDKGIVEEVVRYPVSELPGKAVGLWDKKSCLKFLDAFLKFVQRVIGEKSEKAASWLFDCRNGIVTARKVDSSAKYEFLPGWYVELINKNNT